MDEVSSKIMNRAGIFFHSLEELNGTMIDRELLLGDDKYEEIKQIIPELKRELSSTYLTSLHKTAEKKQKIALETLSSFLAIALSFDEQGDQMIAKLCFSHLQLNYSQPTFSFSNFCKLKPIEFDF